MRSADLSPAFYEGRDLDVLVDVPNYYQWILETFKPHLRGRVIEVGAGTGNFASQYASLVDQLVLVEPAQNLFPRLQARFANHRHVEVRCGYLESVSKPAQLYDAVVLVNVLEHVEDDRKMLTTIHELIRPGGALLLFVPALPWLYGTLDRRMQHVRRYSRSALSRAVLEANFKLQSIRYFDLAGVAPWLILGRVLRRDVLSEKGTQLYDRWMVPATRFLERWVAPPLGKNLICVAISPADRSRS